MVNVQSLLNVYDCLNESNRFAVLVYARMKIAFQKAVPQPYVRERRKQKRYRVMQGHALGSGPYTWFIEK